MIDPSSLPQLTVDEAVAEFIAMARDVLGDAPSDGSMASETPQEAETRKLLMARHLIGLACPAPTACRDQRCRREAMCWHQAHVLHRWKERKSSHPMRTPGADLLRYAMWVYVSARRRGEGRDWAR